jgi:hypothetical protein
VLISKQFLSKKLSKQSMEEMIVASMKVAASADATTTSLTPWLVEADAESAEAATTGAVMMYAEDTRDHASVDATLTDGTASTVADIAEAARTLLNTCKSGNNCDNIKTFPF